MDVRRVPTIVGTVLCVAFAASVSISCDMIPTRYLVVTTTVDGSDADRDDGVCEMTPGLGDCSLRAAIDEANVTTVRVDIALPAGTYALTRHGVDDDNHAGDLDLHGPAPTVGIHSSDAGATIDADGNEAGLQIGSSTVGTAFVSVVGAVEDVTAGLGAGVVVGGSSTLTMFSGRVADNQRYGVMVETGATFRSSYQAITDDGWFGIISSGTLSVDHTLVSGNTEAGVRIANSTATITDSTIRANGFEALIGGGIVSANLGHDVSDITIERTTIDHNGGSINSGVAFGFGRLSIADSTITDNTSDQGAAGLAVDGGITPATPGESQISVTRTTITGNHWARGSGAAQVATGTTPITFSGSIIDGADDDCAGPLVSGGYNVVSDPSCALATATDQIVADPHLGPLGDHGGPTATRLPDAGSPVVDAIPVGTVGLCDAGTGPDQRGVARPFGPACDIGSVERDAA